MQKKWLNKEVNNLNLQIKPKFNVELRNFTTFRIGGKCDVMLIPKDKQEYIKILDWCYIKKLRFRILGAGSNLLVDSYGVDGVVILTRELSKVCVDKTSIKAECGVKLPILSKLARDSNIGGFEFCAGIPGSIGGAVVGNAGAFGSDMSKIVESVTFWSNGKVQTIKNEKILFNYRKSVFKNDTTCAIIEVNMQSYQDTQENISTKIMYNQEYRATTQNVGYPNAGCIFNNTEMLPAVMIEKSHLKGYRVGEAMISHKHSNFVVNLGNATSEDVLELITNVKNKIYRDWDKKLNVEIIYWSK